jgi:hypothetical protein
MSIHSGTRGDDPGVIRVRDESELGTLPGLPPGTVVERIAPGGDVWRFVSVGCPEPLVRAVLGWHHQNVWLRQEELNYMLSKRSGLLTSIPAAIAFVLTQPLSVHDNPRAPGTAYFIAEGHSLRSAGLLQSTRTSLIDLVVETRRVFGGAYLRVTHFSPTRRNFGGRQLWP